MERPLLRCVVVKVVRDECVCVLCAGMRDEPLRK